LNQRIAFVTCERLPDIHGDDRLVANALQRRGFQVTAAVWNDPAVDWRQFASVVIRAAWDYHLDDARYAAWLRRCEAEEVNLWNPAATVLANIDKEPSNAIPSGNKQLLEPVRPRAQEGQRTKPRNGKSGCARLRGVVLWSGPGASPTDAAVRSRHNSAAILSRYGSTKRNAGAV
jgi:hypothetical protein